MKRNPYMGAAFIVDSLEIPTAFGEGGPETAKSPM